MKFSVIVPTYNRKSIIGRAVGSILRQTEHDFELLVIDDGSTDGTDELFRYEFTDERIRYIRLSRNQGVHVARNKGLDEAKGKYIAFFDSDDEMYPTTLERVSRVFDDNKTVGCVFGALVTQHGVLTSFDRSESGIVSFNDLLCGRGLRQNKGAFAALRSDVVADTRWEAPFLQFIFYRYIAKKTQLYYLAKPVGVYHTHSDSHSVTTMRSNLSVKTAQKQGIVLEKYLGDFGEDIIRACPVQYTQLAYGAMLGLLLGGYRRRALTCLHAAGKVPKSRQIRLLQLVAHIPLASYILQFVYQVRHNGGWAIGKCRSFPPTLFGSLKQACTGKLSRIGTDRFLARYASTKRTLDVGGGHGNYRKYFPNSVVLDIENYNGRVDVVGDAHALPFEDESFDVVLCSHTLFALKRPKKAIEEMKRVVKAGGIIVLVNNYAYPLVGVPYDYYRLSKYALQHLFADFSILELTAESTQQSLAIIVQRIAIQTNMRGGRMTRLLFHLLARLIYFMPNIIKQEYGNAHRTSKDQDILPAFYYLVAQKNSAEDKLVSEFRLS